MQIISATIWTRLFLKFPITPPGRWFMRYFYCSRDGNKDKPECIINAYEQKRCNYLKKLLPSFFSCSVTIHFRVLPWKMHLSTGNADANFSLSCNLILPLTFQQTQLSFCFEKFPSLKKKNQTPRSPFKLNLSLPRCTTQLSLCR